MKLDVLRQLIKVGAEELERGEFIEVDDVDLDAFLDGLVEEGRA